MSLSAERPSEDATAAPATEKPPWPTPVARRWLWLLFLLGWTIALIVPVPFREPGKSQWAGPLFTFSKFLHLSVYALIAASISWLRWPLAARWVLLLGLVGHGMLTEYLQWLLEDFSHRSGKWSDVGLDCAGLLIGVILTWRRWLRS